MASLRKKPNSAFWYACFTDAKGKRVQCSTGVKDMGTPSDRATARQDAKAIADGYEEAARGQRTELQIRRTIARLYERANGKRLAFAQAEAFLRDWLNRVARAKSPATLARYRNVVDRFIESLGERRSVQISDITPEDIQRFINAALAAGKSPQTVRIEAKILNTPFAYATRRSLIISNPVPAAEIPAGGSETRNPFSTEQVSAILAAADGEWKTVCHFGAYLGARLGDCTAMRWRNVDLAARLIRYRPQKTAAHKKDLVVPIHPALEQYLLGLRSSDDPEAFITPSLAVVKIGGRSGQSRLFQAVMARAGIENETVEAGKGRTRKFNRYGFHSFRHTFKSQLVNSGIAAEVADVLQGHAKKSVSETYVHRSMNVLRAAVEKLPAY